MSKEKKISEPEKIVQRLDFTIPKEKILSVLREAKSDENLTIVFGIDLNQRIWVSVAAESDTADKPECFVQQLNFSVTKRGLISELNDIPSDGLVKISFGICNDQRAWLIIEPWSKVQKNKKKTIA